MKVTFAELQNREIVHSPEMAASLKSILSTHLAEIDAEMVQDLTHISQAACYSGEMSIDAVEYLKDNLYRCDYSYNWQIAWTCSGTQEAGRVKEKVRFTVADNGEIEFKFLKLEL